MTSSYISIEHLGSSLQEGQEPLLSTPTSSTSCKACNCGESGSCGTQQNIELNPIPEIVEVLFKGHRRAIFSNPSKLRLPVAASVIVEAKQGYDIGIVIAVDEYAEKHNAGHHPPSYALHPVLRLATEEDITHTTVHRTEEHDIVIYARVVAKEYGHDIKITDAEWQLDRKQLTIYFTSPTRIDFRELAKAYARKYKTRIELRQISQRDEAKRLGGFGICGKQLCCVSFKSGNEHPSPDHNRLHNLSKNSTVKLIGVCGRLKCCLLFESESTSGTAA